MMSSGITLTKKRGPPQDTKAASAATKQATTDTNASALAVPVLVDTQILQLAAQWLDPKELANCSRVCQNWYEDINNSDGSHHTWKQAALTVTPQASLDALAAAAMPGGKKQKLGYYNMAKGLACFSGRTVEENPIIRKPEVKAEDLLLLLEIKVFGRTHAWCKSLEDCVDTIHNSGSPGVCFLNMYADEPLDFFPARIHDYYPLDYVGELLFYAMNVSLSLWRRDTGQSYCFYSKGETTDLMDDFKIDDIGTRNSSEDGTVGTSSACNELLQPIAKTMAGMIARSLFMEKDIHSMDPVTTIYMEPAFSVPGSVDERELLQENVEEDRNVFTVVDQGDPLVAKVVKCRFANIEVRFDFLDKDERDMPNGTVNSKDDFLLILEGLDWK